MAGLAAKAERPSVIDALDPHGIGPTAVVAPKKRRGRPPKVPEAA